MDVFLNRSCIWFMPSALLGPDGPLGGPEGSMGSEVVAESELRLQDPLNLVQKALLCNRISLKLELFSLKWAWLFCIPTTPTSL